MNQMLEEIKLLGIQSLASLPSELARLNQAVAAKKHQEVADICQYLILACTAIKEEHIIYITEKENTNGTKSTTV